MTFGIGSKTILKTFAALAGVKPTTDTSYYSEWLAEASCTKRGVFCLRIESGKVYGRVTLGSSKGSSTNCFDFTEKRKKEPKNLEKKCKNLLDSINAVTLSTLCKEDKILELLIQGSKSKKTYSVVFKRDSIDNPVYQLYGPKNFTKTIIEDEEGKKVKNKYKHTTIFRAKDHSGMPEVGQTCTSEYIGVEFD